MVASGPGDDVSAPEDQFEICVPADGDVCKKGLDGSGIGQFGTIARAQGVAVDGNGDIYAVDRDNARVQKFDSEGNFLLMFGGGVNQGPLHPGDLCTAQHLAEGDSCGAGTEGNPGPGEGQFSSWPVASLIAIGPANKVYVGDQERIQIFKADGSFDSQLALPGKGFVSALAVAPGGNIYAGFAAGAEGFTPKPDVLKLNPSGTATLCTIEVAEPTAIALGAAEGLYVVDDAGAPNKIRQFDSACGDKQEPFGEIGFSTGIATGGACTPGDLSVYVSNLVLKDSYVAAYGPRPDLTLCPPPKVPPTIDAQYATAVGTDSAQVRAQINPHFWGDATYYVEYGTAPCAVSTCAQAPVSPGLALKGGGDVDVTTPGVLLSNLQPGTTYHYRFVAQSSGGGPVFGEDRTFTTFPATLPLKTDCPNQAFHGGLSGRLSDCRAYEMVSPIDKNGGDIAVLSRFTTPRYQTGLEQSSTDGEKLTYSSATAFGDALSAPFTSQYIATRIAGAEWSTHAISPPREADSLTDQPVLKLDRQYKAFSADLCTAWLQHDSDPALAPGAPEGVINVYRRDNCGAGADSYETLTTSEPLSPNPASTYETELQGFSADGAQAFFIATDKLTEDAASGTEFQLYEASGGQLHYVCVLPNGLPSAVSCTAGTRNVGALADGRENSTFRAVSADGSRVYWSTISGDTSPDKIYLRENPDQEQSTIEGGECTEPEKACTLAVSSGVAQFWTASPDGSKAFFTEGGKLREFRLDGTPPSVVAEGVVGLAGASTDTSRLYFASTKVLSGEDANSEGDKAKEGQANLYLYEAGEEAGEGKFSFIAALASGDFTPATNRPAPLNPIARAPIRRASRVSPDGLSLAFNSTASPTGYDNTDVESGEADSKVFLYSAVSDELACVSCNPGGARPAGRQVIVDREKQPGWAAAQVPTWQSQLYPSRALSDDGNRLFFESYDALLPRDSNGRLDVYEWQRAGSEKACEEAGAELYLEEAGGCLSLISSGQSPVDSSFADASPNGRDVFFETASGLVPQDPGLIDLYDAREGGGLPVPTSTPGCEGEACQGPVSAPIDRTPASAGFHGPGNVKKPSCPKGKVARKGRCVKKHKKHAKKADHSRRTSR